MLKAPFLKKLILKSSNIICLWAAITTLSFFYQGCTSPHASKHTLNRKKIMKAYLTDISQANGISREEAILIAKSQFIFRGHDRNYNLDRPQIVTEDAYHWAIKFDPINKTFKELINEPEVTIIITKGDGSTQWKEQNPQWANR